MIRIILNFLIAFTFLIFNAPVSSIDFSPNVIKKYTLKISRKFTNTYCNSTKFGISKDGAIKFSVGETSKEFSNNKLNKFIDYDLLYKDILLGLANNCQTLDVPSNELENLVFK